MSDKWTREDAMAFVDSFSDAALQERAERAEADCRRLQAKNDEQYRTIGQLQDEWDRLRGIERRIDALLAAFTELEELHRQAKTPWWDICLSLRALIAEHSEPQK